MGMGTFSTNVNFDKMSRRLHEHIHECSALQIIPMRCVMRKLYFVYAKTKPQISGAVTARLISAFVFATKIVQYNSSSF